MATNNDGSRVRYCTQTKQDPHTFLRNAVAPDFKTFWEWVMDMYPRIGAASSLKNYWRVLRMYMEREVDRTIRESDPDNKDVLNVGGTTARLQESILTLVNHSISVGLSIITSSGSSQSESQLFQRMTFILKILYTHWVTDDSTFRSEDQRHMVSTGILAAIYFGCRPCTLFDTRLKFEDGAEDIQGELEASEKARAGGRGVKLTRSSCSPPRGLEAGSSSASMNGTDTCNDYEHDLSSGDDSCEVHNSSPDSLLNDTSSSDRYDGPTSESDDKTDTDDDYNAGPEKTRASLYRHLTIYAVPHPEPREPNLVFMKAHLLHTKGEDNNPRIKTIIVNSEMDHPIFCLVDHVIVLALYDDAFKAKSAKHVENIFFAKMPEGKNSLVLKWKREILDRPVFTQPIKAKGSFTSSQPLRASTWIGYLKRLGLKAGLEHSFIQYGLRRGLLNVINNRAPASIRDQVFDHKPNSGTVNYYLDQEVQIDNKACFLGRPSNEIVQKLARAAALTADERAPTVVRLRKKNEDTTLKLGRLGFVPVSTAEGTIDGGDLYNEKKAILAELARVKARVRMTLKDKARKRHFRQADTIAPRPILDVWEGKVV
ncbi:hypothetical protein MMC13_004152 [Lambiella insularis]|nr:hypothetical protein [Lambiella insularis]